MNAALPQSREASQAFIQQQQQIAALVSAKIIAGTDTGGNGRCQPGSRRFTWKILRRLYRHSDEARRYASVAMIPRH
jgi:hypothetical protein